jgi:predicted nucleic acid-binding Zn ribbon protein
MAETETQTAACKACGAEIGEDTLKCNECGNYPAGEMRNFGIAVFFAGALATIFHLLTGVVISGIGMIIIFIGLIGQFAGTAPAAEHDINPTKNRE